MPDQNIPTYTFDGLSYPIDVPTPAARRAWDRLWDRNQPKGATLPDREFPPEIPTDHVPMPFSFTDLEADPYGCAVHGIRILIRTALTLEGSMSESEHHNLVAFEEFLRARDNA